MATERRLIEVESAWKKAQRIYSDPVLLHVVRNVLDSTPTVDAVEVVRCKDCKHFVAPQGVPVCDCFYGLGFPKESGNDFCSYGERRTDNE
jgi:hypothetical protein